LVLLAPHPAIKPIATMHVKSTAAIFFVFILRSPPVV
jgi:hypothetical protein